jgi:integral membrane protein
MSKLNNTEIIQSIRKKLSKIYAGLDGIFTDKEAWGLFKIAAFLETFGWTLLIIGIVSDEFSLPGKTFLLPIGGSIHGVLYIFYVFIVLFGHRSMKWSVWRFIFAEFISVVPYGALVFEQVIAKQRADMKVKSRQS